VRRRRRRRRRANVEMKDLASWFST